MRVAHCLLGLAVGLLTACEPTQSPDDVPIRWPTESFLNTSDGTSLAVLDWGGTGPPLILLAGATRTAYVFEDIARYLTDSRTVIGLTRRRVGHSGVPQAEFGLSRLVDDIIELLDSRNITSADFIGHSFGGAELSYLAVHHPDRIRRAVFLDGGWDFYAMYNADGWWAPWPSIPMSAADSSSAQSVALYFARTDGVLLPVSEVRAAHVFDDSGRLVTLSPNVGDMFSRMIRERLTPLDTRSISVPVLTVRAVPQNLEGFFFPLADSFDAESRRRAQTVLDRWIEVVVGGSARFAAEVPGAEELTLIGAHHDLPNVQPERFLPTVRNFILR